MNNSVSMGEDLESSNNQAIKPSATLEQCIVTTERMIHQTELMNHARCAASGLAALGVSEGDTVALLLRNDFAFFEAVYAANFVGAYAVPVNWHFQASEVNYILKDADAKVLIAHSDLLAAIADQLPPGLRIIEVATPQELINTYQLDPAPATDVDLPLWGQWLHQYSPWERVPTASRNNIIYTSGTTGNPKGVVREPDTELSASRMRHFVETCFGFTPGDPIRTVVTGPVYHSAPNNYALSAVNAGGFVALQERFNPEQLLQWIERYGITHLHMVPTMFVRLLALPEEAKNKYDLTSLVFVTHAAAPCAPATKKAMIEWWGPIVHEYYGGTETGGVTACNSEEALAHPGTVGRAIEGAEVRILDQDKKQLSPGEIGEIFMWHQGFPNFAYQNNRAAREEVDYEGLVSIGDLGYVDEEGYLYVCDRIRDMVISGGVNIYPAEIEAELLQMPGVKDCAVFGIPHAEFGESLCAHVEVLADAKVSEVEVLEHLGGNLAKYKLPKKIVFVDQLPREDSGKIFKRKIRDVYWEGQERTI